MSGPSIIWFDEIGIGDLPAVGGKNASLGEMIAALSKDGVQVPFGFATTADAYRHFIAENALEPAITALLSRFQSGAGSLQDTGRSIRSLILEGEMPPAIAAEIVTAYQRLGERASSGQPSVAVRSSATAEDLPDASFAGQQETFLNVRGERALLDACRRCLPRCSRTGRSATARRRASDISRSPCQSVCSRWSAPTLQDRA